MTDASQGGAVLITRPEPGASETAARIQAMGLRPIVAPVLRIVARPVPRPAQPVAAVLITSRNAIQAMNALARDTHVFAVGDATARAAKKAGFDHVQSAKGTADDLARLVQASLPERGALLLLSGERQGHALAAALRDSGYRVIRRTAYRACPITRLPHSAHSALRAGEVGTALFFSTETAHQFVKLVGEEGCAGCVGSVTAVAISRSAAVALERLVWRRICVARAPNQDEMLALIR